MLTTATPDKGLAANRNFGPEIKFITQFIFRRCLRDESIDYIKGKFFYLEHFKNFFERLIPVLEGRVPILDFPSLAVYVFLHLAKISVSSVSLAIGTVVGLAVVVVSIFSASAFLPDFRTETMAMIPPESKIKTKNKKHFFETGGFSSESSSTPASRALAA